jgi:molecular chaperone DnaK
VNDPIVGIDLGTSNSVVAVCDDAGVPSVLADDQGAKVQPSVVSFHPSGNLLVGATAKQRKILDPKNTVYSAKRMIGRAFSSNEVQIARGRSPFAINEGPNQQPVIQTRAGDFAIPEISALILDHMRKIANSSMKQLVGRAVITVPANFNDAQRSATATAGAIAGLTVVRVLNEPTAAALAYGHNRQLRRIIAVYDFGGGTFDVTILRLHDQVYEVLGTAGDSFLGGDDIDERLVDHMVAGFLEKHRIDLRSNDVAMMRLRAVAEQAKIELSRRSRANIRVDEIAYGAGGAPLQLQQDISRDELVRKVADIVDRTFPVCEEALRLAQVRAGIIEDVVLVGGTTKMPYVRDRVAAFFGRAPRTDVNPEEAVAVGAALQAFSMYQLLGGAGGTASPDEATRTANAFDDIGPTASGAPSYAPSNAATSPMPAPKPPAKQRGPGALPTSVPAVIPAIPPVAHAAPGAPAAVVIPPVQAPSPPTPSAPPPTPSPPARMTARAASTPPPPSARGTERGAAPGESIDRIAATPPPVIPKGSAPLARVTRLGPPAKTLMGVPPTPKAAPPSVAVGGEDTAESSYVTTAPLGAMLDESYTGTTGESPLMSLDSDELTATAATHYAPAPAAPLSAPASLPPGIQRAAAAVAAVAALETPPRAPTVLDVTPRSLGMGTVAGFCEELIRRNSVVPSETKKIFTTSHDNQESVRIRVCQGESRRLEENVILGDLVLEGLERRPRGDTTIEVTFQLDASGLLHVRARDARTGREQRVSLNIVGAQSQEEVEKAQARLQQLQR